MAILIKRYANRKLYNTESSRYITLKGIAKLLEDGEQVQVIDNETGEDITQVALSQILVDNQRAKKDPSDTLLSQILSRGGDALYGAIRKSVDDASDGLGEFQDRFRRIVNQSEEGLRRNRGFPWEWRPEDSDPETEADSIRRAASASPEFEEVVRKTLTDVLNSLELPRRCDIEDLVKNLERVADAIERLETIYRNNDGAGDASGNLGPRSGEAAEERGPGESRSS
ncbi:MAG: polyhydroxyalkanoate synthesis regulator DNA-binding domain-containing protein [Deltaproteobacteria bacterium]|nr:polyhydroxyalkanoate synthesis regulator DNA-binding domain-containing protein [Deltaproteobacteria bacterium]